MVLDPRVCAWPKAAERRLSRGAGLRRSCSRAAAWTSRCRLLGDPFAFAGLLDLRRCSSLVALFADLLATHDPLEILFRPRRQRSPRTCRSARVHRSARPISAATSIPSSSTARRSALMVGLTAAVVVVADRHRRRARLGLFRRLGRSGADAARRHRARHPVPALRDRARGLPRRRARANVVLAVALLLWPNTARVIRSQVLTVRERAYVEAARVTGASDARILFVHVAPNILPLVLPLRLDRHRLGDPDRGERQLPRLRRSGARLVGLHAAGRLSPRRRCRAAATHWFVPPGVCIVLVVVAGLLHQPRLRGGPVPEAAELTRVAILTVEALAVEYRHHARQRCAPSTARRFDVPDGASRRPRRRIGLRQDDARRAPSSGVLPANARIAQGQHRLQGPGSCGARPSPSASAICCGATSPSCRRAP